MNADAAGCGDSTASGESMMTVAGLPIGRTTAALLGLSIADAGVDAVAAAAVTTTV